MRKNSTWTYRTASCMLERREGAKGGAGVAKKKSRNVNHCQAPLPTVVNALKMSQILILPVPSWSGCASHRAHTGKTPSLISMPQNSGICISRNPGALCGLKFRPIPCANTVAPKVRFPTAEKKKMEREILPCSGSFLLSKSFCLEVTN